MTLSKEEMARALFDHWKTKFPAFHYIEWGPWYHEHWLTFADAICALEGDGVAQSALVRAAAERVCRFDWSDNDMDAVATIEALRKAITSAPAQSAWMDIETAPKDKCIMLCVAGFEPSAGRWWPLDECWTCFDWEGYFENNKETSDYVRGSCYEPTHWMPLPAGPAVSSTEHSPGCQSGDFGPCDCNLSKSKKDTCYLERSKIREILIGQADENLHITEQILLEVDALPIVVVDDILAEHELMRRTLETISGNSADQLQATQARGALANIGPAVSPEMWEASDG